MIPDSYTRLTDLEAAALDEAETLRAELAETREHLALDRQAVATLRQREEQARAELAKVREQLTAANHHADGLANDLRSAQQANTAYANQVAAMRPVIEAAKAWRNNTGTYSRYNDELALVASVDAMPKLAEVAR